MMPQHPTEPDSVLALLGLIKLGETDLPGIFRQVTDVARDNLASATDVSITVVGERGPYTAASTGDLALGLDEVQYQRRLGPCLEAATEQSTVLVRDTAVEPRWGRWGAQAAAAGAGSVVSVPLPILDDVDAALNLYSGTTDAFDGAAVEAARRFADHAAVILANAHLFDRTASVAQQMQTAMEHRAVIEQAKGIIMGERRCSAEEAFAVLTKISQYSNRKLRHVAAALVSRTQSPSEHHPQ
jgi:GAF domain-containing protein